METTKKIHYELEHFYPNVDRQKFWDLFVDHDAWSKSDVLPGSITIEATTNRSVSAPAGGRSRPGLGRSEPPGLTARLD